MRAKRICDSGELLIRASRTLRTALAAAQSPLSKTRNSASAARQGLGAARDVIEAEARQRRSKGPLRVRERGKHGLFEDARGGGVIIVVVDGVGCAQNSATLMRLRSRASS